MDFLFNNPSRPNLDRLLAVAGAAESTDTPEMAEIIQRFERLAVKIAASFDAPRHLRDDLANAARMGLVDAVRRHDGRPGFPAFARTYMRGAALRELGRWVKPEDARSDELEALAHGHVESADLIAVEDDMAPWGGGHLALVVDELADDQRNIINLRYRRGLPVKEVAREVGTSGPAVSQRLATIHRQVALALAA